MMRQVTKKGLLTVVATSGVLAVTSGGLAFADANAEGAAVGSPGVISGNVVQVPVHVPINVCNNTINAPGVLNPTFGNSCVNASTKSHQSFSRHSEGREGREGYGREGREGGEGYGREGREGGEGGREGREGREGGEGHVGKAAHEGGREGGRGHEGGERGDEGRRGHEGGEERGEHGRGHEGRGGRFEHDEDEGTAGAGAEAVAAGSPGVISGNIVQVPIDIPINVCNNPINVVVGVLNPTFGNVCANISSIRHNRYYKSEREEYFRKYEKEEYKKEEEHKKEEEEVKKAAPQAVTKEKAQLAKTGAGAVGTVLPASALMLLGGTALYRRARAAKR